MKKELPKRKHPRLKHFDYSSAGAYFVTICTQNRRCVLSQIVGRGLAPADNQTQEPADNQTQEPADNQTQEPADNQTQVHADNRTQVPADNYTQIPAEKKSHPFTAEDVCKEIKYTKFGEIAEQQLLLLEERYKNLLVDKYVIMPNHIHVIFILKSAGASLCHADEKEAGASPCHADEKEAGASPRPTVMDIVCAYKSLTTRECKKNGFSGKLFQTSFYEHIVRNQEDYDRIFGYIHENPKRWMFDELYEDVWT